MPNAGVVLGYVLAIWLATIIALIGYRSLTRQINLYGLLSSDDGTFSPERAQLLLTVIASVTTYAHEALAECLQSGTACALRDPSNLVLSGAAGSPALYVVGKYVRQIMSSVHRQGD